MEFDLKIGCIETMGHGAAAGWLQAANLKAICQRNVLPTIFVLICLATETICNNQQLTSCDNKSQDKTGVN